MITSHILQLTDYGVFMFDVSFTFSMHTSTISTTIITRHWSSYPWFMMKIVYMVAHWEIYPFECMFLNETLIHHTMFSNIFLSHVPQLALMWACIISYNACGIMLPLLELLYNMSLYNVVPVPCACQGNASNECGQHQGNASNECGKH